MIQRFSEVPAHLGMAILSVIPGNPLLWTFLMQNFNLEIAKISVISESGTSENLCTDLLTLPILVHQFDRDFASVYRVT